MKNNLFKLALFCGALILAGAGCFQPATDPSIDDLFADEDFLSLFEVEGVETLIYGTDLPVVSGEIFIFGVEVSNTSNETKELRSVDISRDFLDGMTIIDIEPTTTQEYYLEGLDQDIHEFEYMIPAGESVDVLFTAIAGDSGTYGGDFDICIDGDASCIFESIAVTVE